MNEKGRPKKKKVRKIIKHDTYKAYCYVCTTLIGEFAVTTIVKYCGKKCRKDRHRA